MISNKMINNEASLGIGIDDYNENENDISDG